MKFSLQTLRESNCKNIWHDMINAGGVIGAAVEVPDDVAQSILARCGDELPPVTGMTPISKAILHEQWPLAFQLLAKAAKPQDKGLGDIIERVVGPIGGLKFKLWFKRITGRDCGCGARMEKLNALYPLCPLPTT
jgi:hypothetical protein